MTVGSWRKKHQANFRIQLTATTRQALDKKIEEKREEGYRVVNQGELIRYYGVTYYAIIEVDV